MEYRKFNNKYVVRLEKGEEVIEQITNVCKTNNIRLGSIIGIGATDNVKIGLYDVVEKTYHSNEFKDRYEIIGLNGNITRMYDEVYLHIHISVSDKEGKVYGGHMNHCYISATCEIIIDEIDGEVARSYDDEIGLNLFKFYN